MIADDLFLDAQFDDAEKYCSPSVTVIVHAPRRTADLVRRLVRVRRGNAAMRDAARNGVVGTQSVPLIARPGYARWSAMIRAWSPPPRSMSPSRSEWPDGLGWPGVGRGGVTT